MCLTLSPLSISKHSISKQKVLWGRHNLEKKDSGRERVKQSTPCCYLSSLQSSLQKQTLLFKKGHQGTTSMHLLCIMSNLAHSIYSEQILAISLHNCEISQTNNCKHDIYVNENIASEKCLEKREVTDLCFIVSTRN